MFFKITFSGRITFKLNSCPVSDYESLVPDGEGFWSDPTRSTAEDDTGDIVLSGQRELTLLKATAKTPRGHCIM